MDCLALPGRVWGAFVDVRQRCVIGIGISSWSALARNIKPCFQSKVFQVWPSDLDKSVDEYNFDWIKFAFALSSCKPISSKFLAQVIWSLWQLLLAQRPAKTNFCIESIFEFNRRSLIR